jgi:hypothetical protein
MSVRVNKSITVNGIVIELTDLIDHPWAFIDILRTQFSESTFEMKSSETYENYLKRLFALLYYRQNRPNRSNRPTRQQTNNRQKLDESDDLCFNIIRRSTKSSRVVFKNSGNVYRLNNESLNLLIDAAKSKTNQKFKTSDKLIGVELEFIGDYDKISDFSNKMKELVGDDKFSAPMRYLRNKGDKWVLGIDGSVNPRKNDKEYTIRHTGFELTSPILKLSSKKDMSILAKVCDLIKDVLGGYTNRTCGTHVHMSFPVDSSYMTDIRFAFNECDFLCHFVRSYRKSEASLFDRLVTAGRRANKNKYCKTASVSYMHSRYRKINVTNYTPKSDNLHLEFRQLNGTLDSDAIISWSKLQAFFVDSALKSWNTAKSDEVEPIISQIKLEDVIVSDVFKNSDSAEHLMKMAKIIV